MTEGNQNNSWRSRYSNDLPQDTGITSPQGYNVYPDPNVPYVLKASALQMGSAPGYTNPTAALYASGDRNVVLLSATTSTCDAGCVAPVTKPDPRVHQVKPLYQPWIFKPKPGQILPTPYLHPTMYS